MDGKEYIDFHAGFTVNALGHGNREVNDAIKRQMDKVNQFAELPFESRAELCAAFVRASPWEF